MYVEQERPELPEVSASQEVFQRLVRNDLSVVDSLALIDEKCDKCAALAEAIDTHSQERADLLGGLWEPWDAGVPEGAPTPPPVPAPVGTWAELAQFLVESGVDDLNASVQLEGDDRLSVASVAAGRIADGFELARAAGLSDADTSAWFTGSSNSADATDSPDATNSSNATHSANSPEVTDSADASASDLSEDAVDALANAVRQWDCAAQLIPFYTASENQKASAVESRGRAQVQQLLNLSVLVLASDVPDRRVPSCVGTFEKAAGDSDVSELDLIQSQLTAANLELFAQHPRLSVAGAQPLYTDSLSSSVLIENIRYWAGYSTVPGTPGVRIVDSAELNDGSGATEPTEDFGELTTFWNPNKGD
ncbi:MAG: hypothetical protein Q4D87_03445 [Actinomycetaceae bacterium]|nr:hypothetical protein [Actinomycetaceae bacterium]